MLGYVHLSSPAQAHHSLVLLKQCCHRDRAIGERPCPLWIDDFSGINRKDIHKHD